MRGTSINAKVSSIVPYPASLINYFPHLPSSSCPPCLVLYRNMAIHHTPFSLNESIPHCPAEPHNALKELGYPTSTIIYVIYAVTTLVFATIIAFKYNSVKVFNKKIRTQNISNTLWIIYYVSVGVK